MVEASKVFTFEEAGNVSTSDKHSLEWWIFKPLESGEQVELEPLKIIKIWLSNIFLYF